MEDSPSPGSDKLSTDNIKILFFAKISSSDLKLDDNQAKARTPFQHELTPGPQPCTSSRSGTIFIPDHRAITLPRDRQRFESALVLIRAFNSTDSRRNRCPRMMLSPAKAIRK
jgi:hypothetical protein